MATTIDKWVVELGLDTKAIDKKLLAIDRKLAKLGKLEASVAKGTLNTEKVKTQQARTRAVIDKAGDDKRARATKEASLADKEKTRKTKIRNSQEKASASARLKAESAQRKEVEKKLSAEKRVESTRKKDDAARKKADISRKKELTGRSVRRIKAFDSLNADVRRSEGVAGKLQGPGQVSATSKIGGLRKRGAAAIKAEDAKEIALVRREFTKLNVEMRKVVASSAKVKKSFRAGKFAANGMARSLKNMATSWVSAFAIIAGAMRVFSIGRQFEDMSATLLLTSGNAVAAAKDFEFLSEMSQRIGLSILDTSKSFAKFGVAGRAAGLTDGEMKKAFEDMAITIRATGLSQDKANLSFLALQQMLSNGVVSMQELKLQLSEQLPQTMAVAEKALRNLGHTSGSVKDIISTGAVESGAFVTEMTRLMREQAIESGAYEASLQSMTAQLARLNTAFELDVKDMFDAGATSAFSDALGMMAEVVSTLQPAFKLLGRAIGILTKPLVFLGKLFDLVLLKPLSLVVALVNEVNEGIAGLVAPAENFEKSLEGSNGFIKFMLRSIRLMGLLLKQQYLEWELFFAKMSFDFKSIIGSDSVFKALFFPSEVEKRGAEIDKAVALGERQAISSSVKTANNNINIDIKSTDPIQAGLEVESAMNNFMQDMFSTAN